MVETIYDYLLCFLSLKLQIKMDSDRATQNDTVEVCSFCDTDITPGSDNCSVCNASILEMLNTVVQKSSTARTSLEIEEHNNHNVVDDKSDHLNYMLSDEVRVQEIHDFNTDGNGRFTDGRNRCENRDDLVKNECEGFIAGINKDEPQMNAMLHRGIRDNVENLRRSDDNQFNAHLNAEELHINNGQFATEINALGTSENVEGSQEQDNFKQNAFGVSTNDQEKRLQYEDDLKKADNVLRRGFFVDEVERIDRNNTVTNIIGAELDGWKCTACEFINKKDFLSCGVCNSNRKHDSLRDDSQARGDMENSVNIAVDTNKKQWKCSKCDTSMFYNASDCFRCKQSRNIIGTWQCDLCTLINKCVNVMCDVCNASNDYLVVKWCKKCMKNRVAQSMDYCDWCIRRTNDNNQVKWQCSFGQCKARNDKEADYCYKCKIWRHSSHKRGDGVKQFSTHDDCYVWICVKCSNQNDLERSVCSLMHCGGTRYERRYCYSCKRHNDGWTMNCDKCKQRL